MKIQVLLIFSSVSLAAGTLTGHPGGSGGRASFPGTDDLLDSYAYNQSEQMSSVGASFDDYAAIDDFTYGMNSPVDFDNYTCWGVTTGSAPTSLELLVVEDNAGTPHGAPVAQPAAAVTCGNTGYTYGGYSIWETELDFGSNWIAVDTPVWLGTHRADGTNWYPLGGVTVTSSESYRTLAAGWAWEPFSSSLEAGDLFKIIEYPMALERSTWAGIKTAF